jgi:ribosomal protein S18 acetylase RimI-like enzyme
MLQGEWDVMPSAPCVRQATVKDLPALVPLFDAYRQFYRRATDPEGAHRFLRERFEHNQSVIFIAMDGPAAVGFTQLYPSFSSASMGRIFIVNDVYVRPEARGRGVASALLDAAVDYGRAVGALRLVLSTEHTNTTAQSLYEKLGWQRDSDFIVYQRLVTPVLPR